MARIPQVNDIVCYQNDAGKPLWGKLTKPPEQGIYELKVHGRKNVVKVPKDRVLSVTDASNILL